MNSDYAGGRRGTLRGRFIKCALQKDLIKALHPNDRNWLTVGSLTFVRNWTQVVATQVLKMESDILQFWNIVKMHTTISVFVTGSHA